MENSDETWRFRLSDLVSYNVVFYLLLMLSFVNKINFYITFILFNPLVYVIFCIVSYFSYFVLFFTSNLYYECVK